MIYNKSDLDVLEEYQKSRDAKYMAIAVWLGIMFLMIVAGGAFKILGV